MVLDPTWFDIKWMPLANEEFPEARAKVLKNIYFDADDPGMPAPYGQPVQINFSLI